MPDLEFAESGPQRDLHLTASNSIIAGEKRDARAAPEVYGM